MNQPESATPAEPLDFLVVGAGFAGMYALIQARRRGWSVLGLEAATGVGGVWFWNRYPGARCDVESLDYSYSFDEDLQQEWVWSERYATQPEIRRYAEHVAERFDLHRDLRFGARVVRATFDEASVLWTLETDGGEVFRARYVMFATGSLSTPNVPPIPGLETFAGRMLLTAQWPEEEVDFSGRRVGVVGTGSSGIQAIPIIAEAAERLTVFQRTPNFSVPVLNRDLPPEQLEEEKRNYAHRRTVSRASGGGSMHQAYPRAFEEIDDAERRAAFEAGWATGGVLFSKVFPNQMTDPVVNAAAAEFAAEKIRSIVTDPRTAEDLVPTDHPIGTKRICTDSGYYATFNRDNVELVNLRREPITEITSWGVKTTTGSYELDVLVLATGFDALTGSLTRVDLRGPRGDVLAESWADGPQTLVGLLVPGFPNLFIPHGPGSPSVFANMVMGAEHQVDWVLDLVEHARARGHTMVEARRDAAAAWTRHVDDVANGTLFPQAASWYSGANIEGKAASFMPYLGGLKGYIDRCSEVRDADYAGVVFSS
ncbi:MAG TPA: NAD(P)/FAD-dependent oxidoreductase [Nocardioides sp.]|uniref:flavin-containing monooxygenase n=1 Tax=Nocardioides sp. TaxID=35761 RepID=UPI002CAD15D8|nr:NAD(P)/FAD-dependent oxidoreductase [Nocardioides sp.]HTW15353.1 NAD(P)/FAD-dependent oxidoreductase [Nocardioides sp.]